MNEVIESIEQMKKGKSAGHDKITPEMLKNVGPRGSQLIKEIFNTGRVPEEWKIGIILPILKTGDKRQKHPRSHIYYKAAYRKKTLKNHGLSKS